MKKLFYGLGAIAAVATPVVAVVSCGSKTESYNYKKNAVTAEGTAFAKFVAGLTSSEPTSYIYGQALGENVAAVVDAYDEVVKKTSPSLDEINEAAQLWTQNGGETSDLKDLGSYEKTKNGIKTQVTLLSALTATDIDQLKDLFELSKSGTNSRNHLDANSDKVKQLEAAAQDRLSRLSAAAVNAVKAALAVK